MSNNIKKVAVSYSKLRNELGLVGVEVKGIDIDINAKNNKIMIPIHVKLVRHWKATEINDITKQIQKLYDKLQWDDTYIEQETGEYIIAELKSMDVPVSVISTQKKVKDAKQIQKIKTMDKIEMAEFLRKLKINEQIKFPEKSSDNMMILEGQIPFFAKHTTEAGGIDYYSPGSEPDNLVKCLMITCFSVRNIIGGNNGIGYLGPAFDESSYTNDPLEQFNTDISMKY